MPASDTSFSITTKHMATLFNFLHLLNKYLLSIYYGSGILTGTGINKMGKVSMFMDFRFGEKKMGQIINRQVNNKIIINNEI